ncbi:MAG: bile acid:sodium symporter family protein [Janthinobacterium lividum]
MNRLFQLCLVISGLAVVTLLLGIGWHEAALWQPAAVVAVVGLALGIKVVPQLRSYQYTAWIIVAVVLGMVYPEAFKHWGGVDLRNKWLILVVVQLVMFGMGIQMSIRDFTGLATTGRGVLIGLFCHFSVMPLMGFLLTRIFHFEPEIAAGIILIGSCSSGLASNVMVYLARANMVLSVVVTAMATLAAPFLTPLLLKLLAGTLIEVKFISMMMEIIKIVIVPILAALLHDYLKTALPQGRRVVYSLAGLAAVWLVALPLGLWAFFERTFASAELLQAMEIFSFLLAALVVGVLYHQLTKSAPKLDGIMPYASMFGIIYFTAVTTAAGHDNLLRVGFLLFLVAVLHNAAGYFFGYWLGRLFGLDKNSARTVAFEVGLQNGGMASGLAGSLGKLGTVGLPAAVFSPWMNISGSILANYWRRHPVAQSVAGPSQTTEDILSVAHN